MSRHLYLVEGAADVSLLHMLGARFVYQTRGTSVVSRGTDSFILTAAKVRPLVLLFDPDGPGKRIRTAVIEDLKAAGVTGYVNVEIEKRLAVKRGKVGVAEMQAAELRRCIAPYLQADFESGEEDVFTLSDLKKLGLIGPGSAPRRALLATRFPLKTQTARALLSSLEALGLTVEKIAEVLL